MSALDSAIHSVNPGINVERSDANDVRQPFQVHSKDFRWGLNPVTDLAIEVVAPDCLPSILERVWSDVLDRYPSDESIQVEI